MLTLNADLVFRGVENLQSSEFQTLNITPFVEVPKYKLCNVTGGQGDPLQNFVDEKMKISHYFIPMKQRTEAPKIMW